MIMPTQDELFGEYGRPEAYPPGKAISVLRVSVPDVDNVQAFRYFGNEMAVAFTGGGRSEPGRRFLGMAADPEDPNYWIAAFELTMGAGEAFGDQNVSPAKFSAQGGA